VTKHEGQRPRNLSFGRRCVLGAAVLWSLSGVMTKSLELGPLPIAFYRSLFAGLALCPFVPRTRLVFRPGLIPLGLVFGAMIGLYIAAVKATTAANAIYLQYTAPFWMIPMSALLLRERPDQRSVLGIALAMVGIVVIVLYGYDGRSNEGVGIALGLASGLAYAGVAVGMRALRAADPIWLSAIGNLGGALVLGGWMWATTGPIPVPTAAHTALLIAFGVFQMAIPYALFARGLREIGATEAGLIGLIEPLINPIWVMLVNHELPTRPTLLGGLFLLAGLACRFWPAGRARTPSTIQDESHQRASS